MIKVNKKDFSKLRSLIGVLICLCVLFLASDANAYTYSSHLNKKENGRFSWALYTATITYTNKEVSFKGVLPIITKSAMMNIVAVKIAVKNGYSYYKIGKDSVVYDEYGKLCFIFTCYETNWTDGEIDARKVSKMKLY
jgi:hypothetical protein